ncbi:Vitamin B12 transporter BtuB [subsurface metagenome]
MTINTIIQKTTGLNEDVEIGYGTQKKDNITSSVSSVSGDKIKTTKNTDLVNSITGKLPGLQVLQNYSGPGNYTTNFSIRGWEEPLIIVDGVERSNFYKLHPSEIESVNILKDASAAIYGIKAANGVILVTTKQGKSEKTQTNSESNIRLKTTASIWKFNFDKTEGKPYFHPLALEDGTPLTWLRPEDHPWHRGFWFSWKYINGLNYWVYGHKCEAIFIHHESFFFVATLLEYSDVL